MSARTRLFFIVAAAGLAGVFSFLLVDLGALLAMLPIPPDKELPSPAAMKALSVVQPSIMVAIAAAVGVALAPKVGLHAPVAQAAAARMPLMPALRPQILPGIVGGILGGAAIVATSAIWKPLLPAEVVERVGRLQGILPMPTRLLYGGITEEVLLRWGLMTLLVWAAWRLVQKRQGAPRAAWVVTAILFSSVIFGIGHLPVAFMLVPEPTPALIAFVVVANSLFGVIAGFLYWRRGLESAIIAHMTAHIALYAANALGAYF